MTCPYVTSLDKPCGRPATTGEHCAFHAVLHEFETECEDTPMADHVRAVRENAHELIRASRWYRENPRPWEMTR